MTVQESCKMRPEEKNSWWLATWAERTAAIKSALGETQSPNVVTSFTWPRREKVLVPGACAMRFAPTGSRKHHLAITLGMSQPIAPGRTASQWEFGVYSTVRERWEPQLLYDLVTHFVLEKEDPEAGYWMPLVFFEDHKGSMACGMTERPTKPPIGDIRGLYLWPDYNTPVFSVSTGRFRLMAAVAVTEDEDEAAQRTSPPHLLLLFRRLGVGFLSDPLRRSVFTLPNGSELWQTLRRMPHKSVVEQLNVAEM